MALDSLNVSKNIPLDQKLWRYMKPERLIQILETRQLSILNLHLVISFASPKSTIRESRY